MDGLVAEFVGRAVDLAGLEAAAGQEQREGVAVVVAAGATLRDRQAAEFAAPEDDRALQEAALLQVADQRGGRLIHLRAHLGQALLDIAVVVPAACGDR